MEKPLFHRKSFEWVTYKLFEKVFQNVFTVDSPLMFSAPEGARHCRNLLKVLLTCL
jgi:hypothetical protein